MFNFTTTNVINSNKDLTTGKPLWSTQAASGDKPASLHVKRVNTFKQDSIEAIYKAEASDPKMAKVAFDLSDANAKKGDVLRINLYIGLTQASQDSRYSNDLIYKGKPFSVEFEWKADAAKTAEALIKTINKYQVLVFGEKQLKATYAAGIVLLEATTEYQRFRQFTVDKFDGSVNPYPYYSGEWKTQISLEDLPEVKDEALVSVTSPGYFAGKEGFGTYSYLLHNLRLPTSMRTRAFGINQDETPIIGAKYNQYTIHYCTNRGPLGLNAVGDTVKSVTTHVFYVLDSLASDFEAALAVVAPEAGIVEVPKTSNDSTSGDGQLGD